MSGDLPRELHLHVGLPKTGTTAIQAGLLANRERLAEVGLHLAPGVDKAGAHHDLADALMKGGVEALLQRLRGAPERVIASSEIFVFPLAHRPGLLEELLERFEGELRLHLALRRWDVFLDSLAAQLVRNHFLRPDDPAPSERAKAYAPMGGLRRHLPTGLRRMAETVVARRGPAAMRVWVHPETGPRDAFRTFLAGLPGNPVPFAESAEQTFNAGAPRRRTALLREIDATPAALRRHVVERVARSRAIADDGESRLLAPELRRAAAEEAAPELAALARTVDLPECETAALLAPPPPEPDWRPPAPLAPREALTFLAEGWRPGALRGSGWRGMPRRVVAELWLAGRLAGRGLARSDGEADTTGAERMT